MLYQVRMARAEEVWKFFKENPSKMAVPEEEVSSITSAVCEETEENLEEYKLFRRKISHHQIFWTELLNCHIIPPLDQHPPTRILPMLTLL